MPSILIKGVQENLGKAELTFDKFPIIKIINEAVYQVHRKEVASKNTLFVLEKSK